MTTRGEHIADALRAHLVSHGLKKSALTGALVAEIADGVLDQLDRLAKKTKRLATEDEWLVELMAEPHLAGVDVRRQLAAAQFWCKNNSRACTRRFFSNWLNKAERDRVISPGGAKSPAQRAAESGPAGWLAKLNELYSDSVYAAGGAFEIECETAYQWSKLSLEIRAKIGGRT